MNESLLSVQDVARQLSVCTKTVHRLKDRGDIPSLKIGGQVRFFQHDVRAYLNRNRHW